MLESLSGVRDQKPSVSIVPDGTAVSFCFISQHFVLGSCHLLSPSLSGTSPHRAILSTYVDAHGLCFRGVLRAATALRVDVLDLLTNHQPPFTGFQAYLVLSPFPAPHQEDAVRRNFRVTLELLSTQKIKHRFLKIRRQRCTGEVQKKVEPFGAMGSDRNLNFCGNVRPYRERIFNRQRV